MKAKKVLFSFLTIFATFALAFILMEASLRLINLYVDIPILAQSFSRKVNNLDLASADGGCVWVESLYPHPHFGFVQVDRAPCYAKTNNLSVPGTDDLDFNRRTDQFVILILGGSVAQQMTSSPSGTNTIQEELSNNYLGPQGQKIRIINGALGAWKQPNQLLRLVQVGDRTDAFISIEGYNETTSIQSGERFENPFPGYAGVNRLTDLPLTIFFASGVAKFALKHFGSIAEHSLMVRGMLNSTFFFFNKHFEEELRKTHFAKIFSYPNEIGIEQAQEKNIEKYLDYLAAIDAFAERKKIKGAVVLQPIPNLYKPLAENEWPVRQGLSTDLYLRVEKQVRNANFRWMKTLSLLKVFENEKDLIYVDDIHAQFDPSGYSKGYHMMAKAIAKELALQWQLIPKQ